MHHLLVTVVLPDYSSLLAEPGAGLEHQHSEENAKNENNEENSDGDEEQNFRDASGARSDIRETKKTRDQRYDKKYGCPFEHELLLPPDH
jgi:hypothetical protein